MTPEALKKIYDHLYRPDCKPGRGGKQYGWQTSRDFYFFEKIQEYLPAESSILDAGCGRGYLVKMLIEAGYSAHGTDIADPLFAPGGNLEKLGDKATQVSCEDLDRSFEVKSFDAVMSNDCLEHLASEKGVREALQNFADISRKWVFIGTGTNWSTKYNNVLREDLGLRMKGLHTVIRNADWWAEECSKHFEILEESRRKDSYKMIGTVK